MLGDGRDYFNPRPRALSDFHFLFIGMEIDMSLLPSSLSSTSTGGLEVVALRMSRDWEAWLSPGGRCRRHRRRCRGGGRRRGSSWRSARLSRTAPGLTLCLSWGGALAAAGQGGGKGADDAGNATARYAMAHELRQQALSRRRSGASLLCAIFDNVASTHDIYS